MTEVEGLPGVEPTSLLATLRVLVVDDEADIRLGLRRLLATLGIEAREAESGEAALARLDEQEVDLVVTDLMMPGMTGVELLELVKRRRPETVVVLLTGFGTVQTAVQCLQAGAAHFLTKPFDNDEILGLVRRLGGQILAQRRPAGDSGAPAVVAVDPRMRHVMALIERVAPSPVPVLVEGESGTGKELVARSVHAHSTVAERPFQAINCAALSETLLESELFGHRRGSFTGAHNDHRGLLSETDGGTLFLDEIASMSPGFQAKLLRVLQEKTIRPVGGRRDIPVEFRLVTATNRDLEAMVREGSFREDLYYRLQVVRIHVPPLRDRPGDVLPLARHFLQRMARECLPPDTPVPEITDAAAAALESHPWPGNVRELENAIQRAIIVCCGDVIRPYHLGLMANSWTNGVAAASPPGTGGSLPGTGDSLPGPRAPNTTAPLDERPNPGNTDGLPDYAEAKQHAVESFQREFVQRALERTGGNISRAAEACGMTRVALQKILRQLAIDRRDFEHSA